MDVIERLRAIFTDELGIGAGDVDTAAYGSAPEWDSVAHIHLVEAVEEVFGIRFSDEEIPELTSFSRLVAALGQRGDGLT